MNLTNIWLKLFGTTQWFGIDMGFWVAMFVCVIIVVVMNVVFWGMKPKRNAVEAVDRQRKKR
ncbi:MAG TPA: conjugal transfer protein [Clostridiales bacterium]|nr:conjugal transfer protein [Clostridiales bacterium]